MRYLVVTAVILGALIKSAPLADKKPRIHEVIEREAKVNNVSPELIRAIIRVESNWDSKAVSPVGAMGLMQVMPEHLRYFGYKKQDLFEPEKNIAAGVRLLREELDRFGNEHDALRAYNCGSPRAKRSRCGESYARRVINEKES